MSKNIYNLFREYNKQLTPAHKSKFLASLNYDIRESLKNLLTYIDNKDRFDNIYDGWINSMEEEFIVLEVYSVILKTKSNLKKYCVDNTKYLRFIDNKKNMLTLLLENVQYSHALKLLDVHMFNEEFKAKKEIELREKVLEYLVAKQMVLPKKLINEIYLWVDELKLPTYLTTDIEGDFKYVVTNDIPTITTLKEDIENALANSIKLTKIVENLVHNNRVGQ